MFSSRGWNVQIQHFQSESVGLVLLQAASFWSRLIFSIVFESLSLRGEFVSVPFKWTKWVYTGGGGIPRGHGGKLIEIQDILLPKLTNKTYLLLFKWNQCLHRLMWFQSTWGRAGTGTSDWRAESVVLSVGRCCDRSLMKPRRTWSQHGGSELLQVQTEDVDDSVWVRGVCT